MAMRPAEDQVELAVVPAPAMSAGMEPEEAIETLWMEAAWS